jgi:hypothetical protein
MLDDQVARLTAAGMALDGLRPRLEDAGPWALAERFDHTPEASWGPLEVLAHVEEMLPFWLGEIERIVDGEPEPVPFGRIATDTVRLGVIERDRTLPLRELFARVEAALERIEGRLTELTEAEATKRGLHVTMGELTVTELVERMHVKHLEEHVRQIEAILDADATPAGDPG